MSSPRTGIKMNINRKTDLKFSPIFYISHFYHNPKTGGERYNFEVIKHLKERGLDVRILVDEMMPKFTRGRSFLLYNLFYILKFMDADSFVLFTTDYMHPRLVLLFLFLRLFKDCKIFVLVHHLRHHEIESKILRFLCIRLESIFLLCADVVVTTSKTTKSEIQQLKGRDRNVFVIYPGVEQNESETILTEESNGFNLLFVGDCVRRKGLEYLIESLASLEKDDLYLHVVGRDDRDPAYSEHIIRLIEKNELQSNVIFHGRVDDSTKWKLFHKSHVLVLPSLWEGYGMVIAEAMSCGLPIISTKVGAIPELVKDEINGILVPPADSRSLAGAISYLIDNPLVREEYGKKSKYLSRSFNNWLRVGEQFVEIFRQKM
ncbi:glycosyltransferase family 4 protein [bacterium]|nr:glycosyltransferase family 4 protein [bacterium]